MSRVKYDGWVLKHAGYLYKATFKRTRKEVIADTVKSWDTPWAEVIRKWGYTVVKVKIIEVKEGK